MVSCEDIKAEFAAQLLKLIDDTNKDFLERGVRFCKDNKLFLGSVDVGSAMETSFGICPAESKNGRVGVGTFHTLMCRMVLDEKSTVISTSSTIKMWIQFPRFTATALDQLYFSYSK